MSQVKRTPSTIPPRTRYAKGTRMLQYGDELALNLCSFFFVEVGLHGSLEALISAFIANSKLGAIDHAVGIAAKMLPKATRLTTGRS